MTKRRVCVVVPCHNEEISIGKVIENIRFHLPDSKILVVDNASDDQTAHIATQMSVEVINEPILGKGRAVRRAFTYINPHNFDCVFMLDGDNTYGLENVEKAINLVCFRGYDMVIGKRVTTQSEPGQREDQYRFGHNFGNFLISKLNQLLFKSNISDALSGWRVFSIGFIKSFPGGDSQFEIEAELNNHVSKLGCPTTEVETNYSGRHIGSESKLRTYHDGAKIIYKYLKLYVDEEPLKFYGSIASFQILIGLTISRNIPKTFFLTGQVPQFPTLIVLMSLLVASLSTITLGITQQQMKNLKKTLLRFEYMKYAKKSS